MTPPVATAAARRRAAGMNRVAGARPARRVSGPARPAPRATAAPAQSRPASPRTARHASRSSARPAASARPIAAFGGRVAAVAAAALPLPATRPSAPPRRRPAAVPRPARRRPDLPTNGFAVGARARALGWLRTLPDHRLLDRLIGGRIWIVLLGTLLVGIVTMQLSLLRLNAGIGRAVERSSTLEQRNAALRLSISQLSDSERIVALASQMGFVTPLQGSPRFLTANAADAAKALSTMRVPDPAAAAAATAAATSTDPTATTDPSTAATDPAANAVDPAATAPTTTDPAATTPAAGTTAPAASTTAPAASVTAGGASAPVEGQG